MMSQSAADTPHSVSLAVITAPIIRALPPATQLQFVRESIRGGDLAGLRAIEQVGLFDLPLPDRIDPLDEHASYHPLEYPMVASWGQLLANALEASVCDDPGTGKPYESAIALNQKVFISPVSAGMKEAFGQAVARFLDQAASMATTLDSSAAPQDAAPGRRLMTRAEIQELAQKRFLATCGTLLGVAAALNDASTIHLLADAIGAHVAPPDGVDASAFKRTCLGSDPVQEQILVSERLMDHQVVNASCMHHPMRVAMEFCSNQAIEAMLERGFCPARSTYQRSRDLRGGINEIPKHGMPFFLPESSDDRHTLFEALFYGDAFHVSAMAQALRSYNLHKPDLPPHDILSAQSHLRTWVCDLIRGDEHFNDMLRLALEQGCIDIDPASVVEVLPLVVEHGSFLLFEHVACHVPDAALLGERGFMRTIRESRSYQVGLESYKTFCAQAAAHLIAIGRSDVLLAPIFEEARDTPIIYFVESDNKAAVLRCLEAGADPAQKDASGFSALGLALRDDKAHLLDLMRSFQARRQALQALAELGEGAAATGARP